MTKESDILVRGLRLPVSCVLPGCYSESSRFIFSLSAQLDPTSRHFDFVRGKGPK